MAINWNTVRTEHVEKACELLLDDKKTRRLKTKGIFIRSHGHVLPAKQAMRVAYLLANGLPVDAKLRFSSGESMVQRLQAMGFQVGRQDTGSAAGATDG